jgi:hypothetical protein
MTAQTTSNSVSTWTWYKARLVTVLTVLFLNGGSDVEDQEPIGRNEFTMLMSLVVVATLAFGCVVNGWLF